MKWLTRRNIVGITLVVIGLTTITLAVYMRYRGTSVNEAKVTEFEILSKGQLSRNTGSGDPIDQLPKPKVDIKAVVQEAAKTQELKIEGKTIAILSIPKIDLKVAVGEGTDTATLNYFVGHFAGTAMPGQNGNFALAGHRNYTYNEFFSRLDELKPGDEILVTSLKGQFKYKVNEIKTVDPEEISVLNPTPKPTITLVTCTPRRNPTHRLIVKGEIVKN